MQLAVRDRNKGNRMMKERVWIKGAGDLASGIATRLYRCGFLIVMTDIPVPTTVRRTVAFSPCVYEGSAKVEDVEAVFCRNPEEIQAAHQNGKIAVVIDSDKKMQTEYAPEIVVDAIMAKRNIATSIDEAKVVIGVGPGFEAGVDCDAVVETKRGHELGKVLWRESAIPNTGIPGMIGGYGAERIIRAEADGVFKGHVKISDRVSAGDVVGESGGVLIKARIDGVVRGLLQDGVTVRKGMKSGDIDPRAVYEHCFTVSDKARAIGGGVLEAILAMQYGIKSRI